MTDNLTSPFADYVHARRVGNLLFLAGQGCRDPETNEYAGLMLDDHGHVSNYDIKAQTVGVLRNVERVLKAEGRDRSHLIDVTVFLMDKKDFGAMNQVWNEFFSGITPPTRTTVFVKGLPGLNFVEIKAIASIT